MKLVVTKKTIAIVLSLLLFYILVLLIGFSYVCINYFDGIHLVALENGAKLHAENNFKADRIHYFKFVENEEFNLKPLGGHSAGIIVLGFNFSYDKESAKKMLIFGSMLKKITKRYDCYYIDAYNKRMDKLIESARKE